VYIYESKLIETQEGNFSRNSMFNKGILLNNEKFGLYNNGGKLISGNEGVRLNLNLSFIKSTYKEDGFHFYFGKSGHEQEVVYEFINSNSKNTYYLLTSAVDSNGLINQKHLRSVLWFVSIFIILITYILVYTRSLFVMRPITVMLGKLDKISSANLSERLAGEEENGIAGPIIKTFNKLIDRVEEGYNQQKNFASFVSHELRTPLSIMMGQADVTLLKERTLEEYQGVLREIKDEVRNMTHLVNDLLLMALTNSGTEQLTFTSGKIDDLIWQTRDMILKKYPNYEIVVNFGAGVKAEEDLITNRVNIDLFKNALANLIENACKYGSGHIANILIDSNDMAIELSFQNNGVVISLEDQEHIFEPFYRASATNSIVGHGLGLPLVKSIVDLHKGKISLKSNENEGTVAKIILYKV
jgi:signal transduction histidine kinase